MIASIVTTVAIWLVSWRYIMIPFPVGMFGFVVIQALYICGVYFAVDHYYNSMMIIKNGEESEKVPIGFNTDD